MTNAMRGLQRLVRNRRTWTSPYKIAPNWHCTFLCLAMKRSNLKNWAPENRACSWRKNPDRSVERRSARHAFIDLMLVHMEVRT